MPQPSWIRDEIATKMPTSAHLAFLKKSQTFQMQNSTQFFTIGDKNTPTTNPPELSQIKT